MKPLIFDDTFSGTEIKTLNLKTAVTNLDIKDSNSFLNLMFRLALRLNTSSVADLISTFTLYKVPSSARTPIEVTIFKFSKTFTEGNLSAFESRKFNLNLKGMILGITTH